MTFKPQFEEGVTLRCLSCWCHAPLRNADPASLCCRCQRTLVMPKQARWPALCTSTLYSVKSWICYSICCKRLSHMFWDSAASPAPASDTVSVQHGKPQHPQTSQHLLPNASQYFAPTTCDSCTGHELVLQRDGATRAHIALYSTGRPARGQFKKTLCGSAAFHQAVHSHAALGWQSQIISCCQLFCWPMCWHALHVPDSWLSLSTFGSHCLTRTHSGQSEVTPISCKYTQVLA